MVLTDVPQSGIYYQQGAIVEIVVTLIDVQTGLPIDIQTAAGMSISLLYPDGVTTQTFPASLYTDGSDGKISYVTINDNSQVDLSQWGLYQMQGNAIVGGVALPPSYLTDFYVLKNTYGGFMPAITTPSALILYDSSGNRWAGEVSTSGVLSWTSKPFGPNQFFSFNNLVLVDENGVYWTFVISTLGVVTATQAGDFSQAQDYISLVDANGKSWLISNSQGTLVAS